MTGSWLIVKWIWVAICFIWLAVQVLALRRLKGDLKKRSSSIFWAMFALWMVSDCIRDVFFFENAKAARVGMLVVGAAAIVATVLLAGMLCNAGKSTPDVDVEGQIQSLKLG